MFAMSQDGDALIICDGGLASLVACALAAKRAESAGETPGSIAWFVPLGDETDELRRNAVRAIATLLGLSQGEPKGFTPTLAGETPAQRETRLLLEACASAMRAGLEVVSWAIQPGGSAADEWPELEGIAARMDRTLLCARLGSLDGEGEIRIETPLIDLTDRQIAEFAADLGVATETCWWWGGGSQRPTSEAQRFKPLLEAAGLAPTPA